VRVIAVAVFLAGIAHSQTDIGPRFLVASVKKAVDQGVFSTRPERSRGRIRWTTQLAYLIGYAHRLDFSRVDGSHLGAIYSVEATFDAATTEDQVRRMMQSLLIERFKMRSHLVTTETDGFALSIARNGSKLTTAKTDDTDTASYVSATVPEAGVIVIAGRRASIADLAATLQRVEATPAWDRTGLSARYDFEFRYAQDPGVRSETASLASALQEKLGLSLKKQKGPLETLVVDSIEEPSEN
jgi:uncharacterized protein (TIGR03435 family)